MTKGNFYNIAKEFGYIEENEAEKSLPLEMILSVFKKHLIKDGELLREAVFDLEVLGWESVNDLGEDIDYYFQKNKNFKIKFLIDVSRTSHFYEYKVEITGVFLGMRGIYSEWNFYKLDTTLYGDTTFKIRLDVKENEFNELWN